MGILFSRKIASAVQVKNRPSDELLHRLECKACPLNKAVHLESPKIPASGSEKPLIYFLGEGPGFEEDKEGKQFVGPSGDLLWSKIPHNIRAKVRLNNVVRCRTSLDNRDPDRVEIECCRPSIVRDIEESKPAVIFGLGGFPLSWADKPSGTELWRGRKFPIKIGSHTCWYYAFRHPAYILHLQKTSKQYAKDEETAFKFDINRALAEIESGLPKPIVHTAEYAKKNITCITGRSKGDLKYVLEFLDYAGTCDLAGVDYETSRLRPYYKDSCILTKAVSVKDETVAFGYEHKEAGWSSQQLELLRDAWVRFLKSPSRKVSHNLSFEMEWTCYFYGRDLARSVPWEDSLTQAFVLDERVGDQKPGALALEFITLQYYGINIKKLFRNLNKEKMAEEPLDDILPYNGCDAKYHRLDFIFQDKKIREDNLEVQYAEKLRQVPTVVLTQLKGVPIDIKVNRELAEEYDGKIEAILARIEALPEAKQFRRLTGRRFNPGSPQDVIVILRDILKTREGQKSVKGWSTDKSIIGQIDVPVLKEVLNYREIVKLKGTYVDPMSPGSPDLYDGDLLHQHLGTCFVETGRLESEDPNMQNWPTRTKVGKRVRKQVKAKVVASFDYGQIDARIISCASRSKVYCAALFEDYDIHQEWAERLALHHPALIGGKKFIKDVSVMDPFRNHVKSIWTFALFYGAALSTTAIRFGVDESVLMPLFKEFWKIFWEVKEWQERLLKQFDQYGYIQLFDGLRRRAPLRHGQKINTGIQMSTNRIVMDAMNRLSETDNWLLQPIMQIHDDLTFRFDSEREFEDNAETILDIMLDGKAFSWFCVPLSVDIKLGLNWGEQEKFGTYSSYKRLGWPVREKEFL